MEKTRPFYKRWYFWVAIVIWFIVLANVGKKNTVKIDDPELATEASQETTVEAQDNSIEAQVASLLDANNVKYSDLSVIEGAESLKISLHYDDTAWNETRLICSCLTDYIKLCKELYQKDEITKVEYYVFCNLIDSKGNEKSEKGFAMCMTKENFETFNWENLKCVTGSYTQIEADSEYIDIHAGIKKNVDFDKVYYKG